MTITNREKILNLIALLRVIDNFKKLPQKMWKAPILKKTVDKSFQEAIYGVYIKKWFEDFIK